MTLRVSDLDVGCWTFGVEPLLLSLNVGRWVLSVERFSA
jgi:hypothetical protein